MRKTYSERKEEIRNKAILWQAMIMDNEPDFSEIVDAMERSERLGKRNALLKEFHENAIC